MLSKSLRAQWAHDRIHQCSKGKCCVGHTPDAGCNASGSVIRYFEVASEVQRSAAGRQQKPALVERRSANGATLPLAGVSSNDPNPPGEAIRGPSRSSTVLD